jgi:hypothetical protein
LFAAAAAHMTLNSIPQKHYDFGMRALKAVLVMACSLKRRSPDVAEEIVLIQAMRDANLPKLLSEVRHAATAYPLLCMVRGDVTLSKKYH